MAYGPSKAAQADLELRLSAPPGGSRKVVQRPTRRTRPPRWARWWWTLNRQVRDGHGVRQQRGGRRPVAALAAHGQRGQQLLLISRQVVPAPLHHGKQGLLARQRAPAADEELKALLKQGQDLRQAQHPQLRRSEFDGQRNAIQAAADLGRRDELIAGQADTGPGLAGAVDEEPH